MHDIQIRAATVADAAGIAALHAASWRSTYRGILSDAFLAGEADADRAATWRDRLADPSPDQLVLVATAGRRLVGFGCWYVGADERWGTLLDNLHVVGHLRGRGIGGLLLGEGARRCAERAPGLGVHLWVLDGNAAAAAFYRRHGAEPAGEGEWEAPDGRRIRELRLAWPSPGLPDAPRW